MADITSNAKRAKAAGAAESAKPADAVSAAPAPAPAATAAPVPARPGFNIAMVAVVIAMFANPFLGSSLNLSVIAISTDFNVDAVAVGWIVTAYMLSIAAFSIPFGKVADMIGRRPLFIAGVTITGLGAILCMWSPNFAFLLGMRLVQGVGSAMMNASVMPVAISMYPPEMRGRIVGICTSGVYVGGAAGPVVGGFLNDTLGWQSIFVLSGGLLAVAAVLAVFALPKEDKSQLGAFKMDVPGTLLYMCMIVTLLFGFSQVGSSALAVPCLVAGVVFTGLFIRAELRAEVPVIRLTLFTKDRVFTLSCLAALLNYGATSALGYLLAIYLQAIMGFSAQVAGLIMISQPVLMAIISPIAGGWSDKIAPWKLASAGMSCCAVSLGLLAFVGQETSLVPVVVALIFAGVGFGLFSSPNTNAIMGCVSPKEFGVANTIIAAMRTIGQTVSMCLVTVVVAFNLGAVPLADALAADMVSTMQLCFGMFAALCVMGLGMSLARRN